MGRIFGLLGLVIALAAGAYIYSRQARSVSPAGTTNMRASIDVAGVRRDLLNIANAERRYFATAATYGSLDDLITAGELVAFSKSRGPYTYEIEFTDNSFRANATCVGDPPPGFPRLLSIDQNMQSHSE